MIAKMLIERLHVMVLKKKRHPRLFPCSSLLKALIAIDVKMIPKERIPGYFSKAAIETIMHANTNQRLFLLDR